jgi:monoamine oxidase
MARIAVVGAGFAGLTAALRFSQADHDVVVFEARDRVGGRVHSVTLSNGEIAEMGGEWISADQHNVVGLAAELGVPLSAVGVDFSRRDLIGSGPITDAEHRRVTSLVNRAIADLSDDEQGVMTAGDLFARLDDGSDAFKALRNRIEGSAGVAANRIGISEIVGDFGLGEATYLRVEGGNQSLAEAIADRLVDVRLGSPVEAINTIGSGVSISTGDHRFEAEAAVVAVPLPLISRLRFEPPLDDLMLDSLKRLTMGTAAKLALPTDAEPPLVALQNRDATWWCWTGAGESAAARKIVTAFAGTKSAISAVREDWPDQISTALPDVGLIDAPEFIDWGQEKWSQGCYSALAPGDEVLLEVFEKEGSVVFAGEHTLGAGTIDGAIESGEQAAGRLESFLARATASN